jgi:hypothetical protein
MSIRPANSTLLLVNLVTSASAGGLAATAYIWSNHQVACLPVILQAALTFLCYSVLRPAWSGSRFPVILMFFALIGYFVSDINTRQPFQEGSFERKIILFNLLTAFFLVILYHPRSFFIPRFRWSLREFPIIKNAVVAYSWTACIGIPFLYLEGDKSGPAIWPLLISSFIYLFGLSLLSDLGDLSSDRFRVPALTARLGNRGTRFTALMCAVFGDFGIACYTGVFGTMTAPTLIVIWLIRPERKWTNEVIIDLSAISYALLLFLAT